MDGWTDGFTLIVFKNLIIKWKHVLFMLPKNTGTLLYERSESQSNSIFPLDHNPTAHDWTIGSADTVILSHIDTHSWDDCPLMGCGFCFLLRLTHVMASRPSTAGVNTVATQRLMQTNDKCVWWDDRHRCWRFNRRT